MAQPSSILHADRGRASATAWGILSFLVLLQSALVAYLIVTRPKVPVTPPPAGVSGPGTTPPPGLPPLMAPGVRISPPPVGSLVAPSAGTATAGSTMGPPPIGSFGLPAPDLGGLAPPASAPASPPQPAVVAPPSASLPPAAAPRSPTGLPVEPGAGLKRLPLGPNAKAATAAPTAVAGPDLSVKEMVDVARQVRRMGDMQGALETLNKTDLRYPNDPSVLAETAQVYEEMRLTDKAAAIWRRLEAMSPEQGAGYREMAARRLTGGAGSAVSGGFGGAGADGPKVLSLGACQAARDASVVNGEKVVLRIPLLRQGSAAIDPGQVDIDVYFFDRVNGEKVEQTIADDPVTSWGAPPVDWSGMGEEPLNVTYFLPQLTPGEIQAHGRRSYHGYVVKLYYQHKLQDVAAEPRDLLEYGSNGPQAGAGSGNPLLPPVSQ